MLTPVNAAEIATARFREIEGAGTGAMVARPRTTSSRIGVPLSIGPVMLATNLLLAPIANYCDLAFRIVCREQGGLGLACTDLLSPHGLLRGTARSLDIAQSSDDDKPVCMQLYGADGEILAEGARWAVDHGATVVDINMGCPVDKVTKKNGGSMLLCDPRNTVAMTEKVVCAVDAASGGRVPVTAKMRLGWSESALIAPWLARELEKIGVQLVTVHGRTTQQKFTGRANRDGIRRVVEAVERIPVVGNGDVTEPRHVVEMMEETGCSGVMIGRWALAAPWIFRMGWAEQRRQIANGQIANGSGSDPSDLRFGDLRFAICEPGEAEKIGIIRRYFSLMLEFRDERYAMNHIRRRVAWFGKKLGPCKPLREAVRTAAGPAEVFAALDEFLAGGLRKFPPGAPVVERAPEEEADEMT